LRIRYAVWYLSMDLRMFDLDVSAQACHASTAVLHLHRDDPNTESYMAKLDSMHKVVKIQASNIFLKVPNSLTFFGY